MERGGGSLQMRWWHLERFRGRTKLGVLEIFPSGRIRRQEFWVPA